MFEKLNVHYKGNTGKQFQSGFFSSFGSWFPLVAKSSYSPSISCLQQLQQKDLLQADTVVNEWIESNTFSCWSYSSGHFWGNWTANQSILLSTDSMCWITSGQFIKQTAANQTFRHVQTAVRWSGVQGNVISSKTTYIIDQSKHSRHHLDDFWITKPSFFYKNTERSSKRLIKNLWLILFLYVMFYVVSLKLTTAECKNRWNI